MEFTPINNRKDSSFYQEEMEIRFCQCDASHRLKVSELFRIMTNLADMAFEFRGMDHQFLMKRRMVFLITRVSVNIHRMPLQIEKIRAATWEQSVDRAQFIRNFAVWSETGELLVEASSGWVLVDPVLRSILRPAQFDEAFPGFLHPQPENLSGAPAFARLRLKETAEGVESCPPRRIVYSDIDGNGHVDNARYIEMAFDVLPESLTGKSPREVQIVFSREAMPGETLSLYRKIDGEKALTKALTKALIKGAADGKDSFLCEVTFDE